VALSGTTYRTMQTPAHWQPTRASKGFPFSKYHIKRSSCKCRLPYRAPQNTRKIPKLLGTKVSIARWVNVGKVGEAYASSVFSIGWVSACSPVKVATRNVESSPLFSQRLVRQLMETGSDAVFDAKVRR